MPATADVVVSIVKCQSTGQQYVSRTESASSSDPQASELSSPASPSVTISLTNADHVWEAAGMHLLLKAAPHRSPVVLSYSLCRRAAGWTQAGRLPGQDKANLPRPWKVHEADCHPGGQRAAQGEAAIMQQLAQMLMIS